MTLFNSKRTLMKFDIWHEHNHLYKVQVLWSLWPWATLLTHINLSPSMDK